MADIKKSPINHFVFLGFKTGTSAKTGKTYEILEVSKDFKNFNVNIDKHLDRSLLNSLEEFDIIECTFRIEGNYEGNAMAVLQSLKKVS